MLKTLGNDDRLLGQLAQWYKTNKLRDQARTTFWVRAIFTQFV